MTTYVQPEGTENDTYFHGVKINPATLADGTLHARLDQRRYPKVGTRLPVALDIDSVSPSTLVHGLGTTLTIDGDQFTDDTVVTFSGTGITVVSTTNVDNEGRQLRVEITTTVGAAMTARNVTVTNPDGGTAVATGALTLLVAPITVASATPNDAEQGSTDDYTVSGTGFAVGAVASVSGAGVTVNSTNRTNATTLVVNITVAGGAAIGARNLTVTNLDAGAATATGAFTVKVPLSVVSANPATLAQGSSNTDVTITGTSFEADAEVTISGAGVTVNSTEFTNSTTLVADISVTGGATVGARDVTVTNADLGTATAVGALTITV